MDQDPLKDSILIDDSRKRSRTLLGLTVLNILIYFSLSTLFEKTVIVFISPIGIIFLMYICTEINWLHLSFLLPRDVFAERNEEAVIILYGDLKNLRDWDIYYSSNDEDEISKQANDCLTAQAKQILLVQREISKHQSRIIKAHLEIRKSKYHKELAVKFDTLKKFNLTKADYSWYFEEAELVLSH
jgi:hypothetical protein